MHSTDAEEETLPGSIRKGRFRNRCDAVYPTVFAFPKALTAGRAEKSPVCRSLPERRGRSKQARAGGFPGECGGFCRKLPAAGRRSAIFAPEGRFSGKGRPERLCFPDGCGESGSSRRDLFGSCFLNVQNVIRFPGFRRGNRAAFIAEDAVADADVSFIEPPDTQKFFALRCFKDFFGPVDPA